MEKKQNKKQNIRLMALTVKAVVINPKNEVLILKRAADDKLNPGKYDLPGGHVDENESYRDSILREIEEEAGLKADFGEVIDVVEFPKDSPLFKAEKRGIRCICYSQSGEVEISNEHDGFEWVTLEKAADKFSEKNGFENEKKKTILKAQKYLEMKESLNGWKRALADFENYKKRQTDEKSDMIAFSNQGLILEILPVLDNFYASIEHIPEDQKEGSWVVGIMHIQNQLKKILEDNGAEEIVVKEGDDFSPETMEAVKQEEKEDERKNSGKVEKILQKGYKMGGKVIRAAKVVVD